MNSEIYIKITPELSNHLRQQAKRTGIGPIRLLRMMGDKPDKLTYTMIESWKTGNAKSGRRDFIDRVLDTWKSLPDKKPRKKELIRETNVRTRRKPRSHADSKGFVLIQPGDLEKLRHYHNLGYLPGMVINKYGRKPEGLSAPIISAWLSGKTDHAKPAHLNFVLGVCRYYDALPTRRVSITKVMKAALYFHYDRTGIGPTELLRQPGDAPEGLTPNMISGWINDYIGTARQDHLDYTLFTWGASPDKAK